MTTPWELYRLKDKFSLFEAACHFAEKEPTQQNKEFPPPLVLHILDVLVKELGPKIPNFKPSEYYQYLINGDDPRQADLSYDHPDPDDPKEFWQPVQRQEFIDLAIKLKMRPKFLFPEVSNQEKVKLPNPNKKLSLPLPTKRTLITVIEALSKRAKSEVPKNLSDMEREDLLPIVDDLLKTLDINPRESTAAGVIKRAVDLASLSLCQKTARKVLDCVVELRQNL